MATFALDSLSLSLKVKKWLILQICFFVMIFKKMIVYYWNILKMNEIESIETIEKINLTDQTKLRLNEISKIEN